MDNNDEKAKVQVDDQNWILITRYDVEVCIQLAISATILVNCNGRQYQSLFYIFQTLASRIYYTSFYLFLQVQVALQDNNLNSS